MNRREAIRRVAVALGGSISTPILAGLTAGCRAAPSSHPYTPQSLSPEQFHLVGQIAEHIIPATETPGARTARVDEFVDRMLTSFYTPEQRNQFLDELDGLGERSLGVVGVTFDRATWEQQARVLELLDAEAYPGQGDQAEVRARTAAGNPPFMRTMKELTVSGYYTSEVGQTVELRTVPFGEFRADVPFDDVGRAWA